MSRSISLFCLMMICSVSAHAEVLAPSPKAATPVTLSGHKAVYNIKLASSKNGSQIVGISGQMTFAWKASCDGWITDSGFKLRYDYADTDPAFVESHFTTHESFDHNELQFSSRNSNNGKETEQIRGTATNDKANFISPKGMVQNLGPQTIFPTEYTLNLIKAARAHKKFISQHVFDGSDLEGAMDISTVIGIEKQGQIYVHPAAPASVKKKDDMSKIDQSLLNGASWPVRMAFFGAKEDQPIADYEMSLILHENGIISDMVIDYKDFSIQQKLVSLEKIPNDQCGRSGKDG